MAFNKKKQNDAGNLLRQFSNILFKVVPKVNLSRRQCH